MNIKSLFLIVFIFSTRVAVGQTIKGRVTTAAGGAIGSATVSVLNSTKATSTDKEGHFTLSLPAGDYQLAISSVGFATQVKAVSMADKGSVDLSVQLKAADQQLNEVVVTAKKKQQDVQKVPAAVSVIDAKQIRDYRIWDITNLTAIAP